MEQELLTETIRRYNERIHTNNFPANPYYKSAWEERKELIIKVKELELKLTK